MKERKALTAAGTLGAALVGELSQVAAIISASMLLAGSACTRLGVFEAEQESANDPKYTVVPQGERVEGC